MTIKYKRIAGVYPYDKPNRRNIRRWLARDIGPLVVKRDEYIRGYNNTRWQIRYFTDGTIHYYQVV